MLYGASLTKHAERDLEEINLYIAERESVASADRVLEQIVKATETLKTPPDRGSSVNELRSLGISEYRQLFFKPYQLFTGCTRRKWSSMSLPTVAARWSLARWSLCWHEDYWFKIHVRGVCEISDEKFTLAQSRH